MRYSTPGICFLIILESLVFSHLGSVAQALVEALPSLQKYNLIERRFFPHLSRVCTGMLFDTLEHVVELMRKASTQTGLRTTVNVIRRVYETGRTASDLMKQVIRSTLQFADLLPKWNYTITPQITQ